MFVPACHQNKEEDLVKSYLKSENNPNPKNVLAILPGGGLLISGPLSLCLSKHPLICLKGFPAHLVYDSSGLVASPRARSDFL